jgi:thiol-disulfide isomerase/thioredoxin
MKVVAFHFWSPTCGPCKVIKPAIEDLKEEFSQISWVSVNTHDDPNDYKSKFGVQVVPTIVVAVFKDDGSLMSSEKHSGTSVATYYRILRNGLKFTQQS